MALRPVEEDKPVWFGGGRLGRDPGAAGVARRRASSSAEPADEALGERGWRAAGEGPGREERQFA